MQCRRLSSGTVAAAMRRARRGAFVDTTHTSEVGEQYTGNAARSGHLSSAQPSFLLPALEKVACNLATKQVSSAQRIQYSDAASTELLEVLIGQLAVAQDDREGNTAVCSAPAAQSVDEHHLQSLRRSEGAATGLGDVSALLERYNPTLDAELLRRVAARVNLSETMSLARELVRLVVEEGSDSKEKVCGRQQYDECVTLVQRAVRTWRERAASTLGGACVGTSALQIAEEASGIVSRLYNSPSRRSQRLGGFLALPSDMQVHEVLPSGRIVTFTEATLPGDATSPEEQLLASMSRTSELVSSASQQYCQGALFLHLVLYKESMSVAEAIRLLASVSGGTVSVEDIQFNIVLEESAVTVQTCSVRVRIEKDATASEVSARCLLVSQSLLRLNLQPHRLSLQFLDWRRFGCNLSNGAASNVQYSLLVRGVRQHATFAEALAQARTACFPNYFSPTHFGPVGCPFRTYHISSALQQGLYAEALIMTAAVVGVPGREWLHPALCTLIRGEDRPAALREHWQQCVPPHVRRWLECGVRDLTWNVLASCRIHELCTSGCAGSATQTATPDCGDFVFTAGRSHVAGPAKLELAATLPGVGVMSPSTDDVASASECSPVRAILTDCEASARCVKDIAVPLVDPRNHKCDTVAAVIRELGFSDSRGSSEKYPCHFRRLLACATGHPRSERAWVREFSEPVVLASEASADGLYHLHTDLDLCGDGGTQRDPTARRYSKDYTELSRGARASVWPIGKRGHALSDRLPAGLLAASSMTKAQRRLSRCLALSLTLPADTYLAACLRELIQVENRCTAFKSNETFAVSPSRTSSVTQRAMESNVPLNAQHWSESGGTLASPEDDLAYPGNLLAMATHERTIRIASKEGLDFSTGASGGQPPR